MMLGNRVIDIVTGLTGVATSFCEQLNGNHRYAVQPKVDSRNEMPRSTWVDADLLEVVDDGVASKVKPPAPEALAIELGKIGRDKASGIRGLMISRQTYINGCVFYELLPPADLSTRVLELAPTVMIDSFLIEVESEPPMKAVRTGTGGPPTDWRDPMSKL
jgi:hypothetical protein